MIRAYDPSAIDRKFPCPEESADVLVIGAGPAGMGAAIEAARCGRKVTVVDENPLDPRLFGLDVPLYFGARMTGAVRNPGRILEQIVASNPDLDTALEHGVNMRFGVTAWGLFTNGPALRALPGSMVGLADAERSWMCGFDKLILATGARDIAFGFPGWNQPGIMGANGLHCLVERYGAFSGRRIVILGTGNLAIQTALMALRHGLEIVALVEVCSAPQACSGTLQQLTAAGVRILQRHVPSRALGGTDGVEQLIVRDPSGRESVLDCDTVCMAVGLAPAVELLHAAGGAIVPDSHRGGHVPALRGWQTSLESVVSAGDCAGCMVDTMTAPQQGRYAVRQSIGADFSAPEFSSIDNWWYQKRWYEALTENVDPTLVVCQCEGVSRGDILAVRAPEYVGGPRERSSGRNLKSLIDDGPLDQNEIKRLTRACMGVCQARRCREQVAFMLAQASSVEPAAVPLAGYRAPVRPLPLGVLADWNENAAMTADWEGWFRIRGQWAAYEDIGTEREFSGDFVGG